MTSDATTKQLTVYDRIQEHLFDAKEETSLSERDFQTKQRIQAGFVIKMTKPAVTDREIIKWLITNFQISLMTAYKDLAAIENICVNVRHLSKENVRQLVVENLKFVVNLELDRMASIEEYNRHTANPAQAVIYPTHGLTQALNALAKAMNLDKYEANPINWDEVQPPIIEPTSDATILDLELVPTETIEKLREKYLGKMTEIQRKDSQ